MPPATRRRRTGDEPLGCDAMRLGLGGEGRLVMVKPETGVYLVILPTVQSVARKVG